MQQEQRSEPCTMLIEFLGRTVSAAVAGDLRGQEGALRPAGHGKAPSSIVGMGTPASRAA